MSSEDVFEKNVAELVKHGALRPDAERAKRRFLRPERTSWKIAAAAAAALVAATIVWSARREPSPPLGDPLREGVVLEAPGGNELLKGVLKVERDPKPESRVHFEGRSPLPEGVEFNVRVHRLEEKLVAGRLERTPHESPSGSIWLRGGAFDYEFPFQRPGVVRLEVTAKDAFQDTAVIKVLKVPESEREWTFSYRLWDAKFLSRVGPQLLEAADLVAEVRELLGRVEASVSSPAEFARQKQGLIAEAQRLYARGESFAKVGLYPASARAAAHTAQDLSASMEIFTFEGGRFDGPKSYYTDGKRGRDHRNASFEFSTLRGYLDEAVRIAGREFGLWILEEHGRAPRPELADAVKPHKAHPGLAPFAERLMALEAADLVKLNDELRSVGK